MNFIITRLATILPNNVDFDNSFRNSLSSLNAKKKRHTYFVNNFDVITPLACSLGGVKFLARLNKHGQSVPVMRPKTFQYIPVRDYLTVLFSNVNFLELYFSETPSTDGFLRSHRDGLHFKNSILYSRDRFALRLQLFGDEVEVTNPLESKVKQHELLNIYGRILNLPPHVNSTLSSIFCVAVVNSSYLNTKDVYDVVLGHIVEELIQL